MIAFAIRDPLGALPTSPLSPFKSDSPVFKPTRIPTKMEEVLLIKRAQAGNLVARNELIERNLPFVLRAAKDWYEFRGRPRHLEYDDLIQACFFGMVRAIEKFDLSKTKGRFIGYAKFWVRHFMDAEIHYSQGYRVPQAVRYKYDKNELKNDDTRKAVERFCDMQALPDEYDVTECRSESRDPALVKEQIAVLKRAMSRLSQSSWVLLKERYIDGLTLKEMGDKRNKSRERMRQLLREIENGLKKDCAEYASI